MNEISEDIEKKQKITHSNEDVEKNQKQTYSSDSESELGPKTDSKLQPGSVSGSVSYSETDKSETGSEKSVVILVNNSEPENTLTSKIEPGKPDVASETNRLMPEHSEEIINVLDVDLEEPEMVSQKTNENIPGPELTEIQSKLSELHPDPELTENSRDPEHIVESEPIEANLQLEVVENTTNSERTEIMAESERENIISETVVAKTPVKPSIPEENTVFEVEESINTNAVSNRDDLKNIHTSEKLDEQKNSEMRDDKCKTEEYHQNATLPHDSVGDDNEFFKNQTSSPRSPRIDDQMIESEIQDGFHKIYHRKFNDN